MTRLLARNGRGAVAARRGKFARLVTQCVDTIEQFGGTIDPQVVADELQARIDAIAGQLRITAQTALRSYIPDDWGEQMATESIAKTRELITPSGPAEHLAVRVAGRLQAALGQALIYAAHNDDQQRPYPVLNLQHAGEAVSGLGIAVRDAPAGAEYVTIGGDVAAWTREILEAFRDQLRTGAWTFCPCGEAHGQHQTDAAVLAMLDADLLCLAATPST
jgi:hypothetical protein